MSKNMITGLGYCGLDYLSLVPNVPIDDKVEIIQSLIQGGGPAATAACTAARLGAKTAFIGVIGDDALGQEILIEFAHSGVDTSNIKLRLSAASPKAFCWIEQNGGKRSIVWTHGTARALLAEELNVSLIEQSDLLNLDGHQTAAAIRAAEIARESGTTVLLDAGTLTDGIERLLELSDIIIASEKFAERYTGSTEPEESLKRLFSKNTKFAAVTLGNKGSIGFDGKKFYRQAAFKVEVVDTTGAGDVFHGAFAYKYVNGGAWRECLRFATAVSALKCTRFGGRTGIPTLAEVENFLENH